MFLQLGSQPEGDWKERFRSHPAYARNVESNGRGVAVLTRLTTPRCPASHPGSGTQLAILVRRYVDIIRSDRRMVALLAMQGPLLGAILWAVLRPNSLTFPGPGSATVALFLAVSVTWVGTAAATREIVTEQHIFRQERGTGLSVGAYVASKALTLAALTIVQAGFLTWIAASRQAPPAHGAVLSSALVELMVGSALVGVAAVAIGLLLSAAVDTPDKALTILPVALVAQLVLSGSWVSAGSVPGLGVLRSLTGAHWGVRLVESTVSGDAGDWWAAAGALVVLTAFTLRATVALVHRRVRPARPALPFSYQVVNVLPRIAPIALAVLAVTGMGASSWALVDARASRGPSDPPVVSIDPTTTVPELLGTTPQDALPTTVVGELAPPPVEPEVVEEDGGTQDVAAPATHLIGNVSHVVGGAVAPLTDVVDHIVSPPTTVSPPTDLPPPTTVPTPVVTVPVVAPATPMQSLMELAWQWYLVSAAYGGQFPGSG